MYAKKWHSFRKGTSFWEGCQTPRYKGRKTLKYKRKRETISILAQEVVLTLLFDALKVLFTGHTFNFSLVGKSAQSFISIERITSKSSR